MYIKNVLVCGIPQDLYQLNPEAYVPKVRAFLNRKIDLLTELQNKKNQSRDIPLKDIKVTVKTLLILPRHANDSIQDLKQIRFAMQTMLKKHCHQQRCGHAFFPLDAPEGEYHANKFRFEYMRQLAELFDRNAKRTDRVELFLKNARATKETVAILALRPSDAMTFMGHMRDLCGPVDEKAIEKLLIIQDWDANRYENDVICIERAPLEITGHTRHIKGEVMLIEH